MGTLGHGAPGVLPFPVTPREPRTKHYLAIRTHCGRFFAVDPQTKTLIELVRK